MDVRTMEGEGLMTYITCPWCELELALVVTDEQQTCPECRTTWSYEADGAAELELAPAA